MRGAFENRSRWWRWTDGDEGRSRGTGETNGDGGKSRGTGGTDYDEGRSKETDDDEGISRGIDDMKICQEGQSLYLPLIMSPPKDKTVKYGLVSTKVTSVDM